MARGRRAERREFVPTYDDMEERADNRSAFDPIFKDITTYKPKQGSNLVRILPPTWEGARHYGLRIKVHRNIGPNDRQYLCLRENDTSPHKTCPICEELYNLGSRASTDDKRDLRAADSVVYYVIDRDNEKEGIQVWQTSAKNDSEIAAQAINRRSKAALNITHPDTGRDVEFTRTGTTRNNTRYRGFHLMPDETPLAENDKRYNEWLDEVYEHPLTSVLQFYKPTQIEEVFYGRSKDDDKPRSRTRDQDEEEEGETRTRRRSSSVEEEEEEKPQSRRRSSRDEDEEEKPSRRGRGRDEEEDEEEEKPRQRRSRDEDEEEEKPRRGRSRAKEEDEEEEEKPVRRGRTQTEEDLDDEIPSEGRRRAKPNGRDDEAEQPRKRARLDDDEQETRPARRSRAEPEEEAEERPTRSRRTRDLDEEEEEESPRRGRSSRNEDEDDNTSRRSRMRTRLDRSAD